MSDDVLSLTAAELVGHYGARRLSPLEVTRAALDRIGRLNPVYNAFVLVDEPRALKDARASEARWMRGEPAGLLDGIPATVHAAGAKIWSPDLKAITPQVMAEAKKLGLRVVVWTANEPADIRRMIDAGVDGIISDYPDRVLAALKRS